MKAKSNKIVLYMLGAALLAAALCIGGCNIGTITGLDDSSAPPAPSPVPPTPGGDTPPVYHDAGFYTGANDDGTGGTKEASVTTIDGAVSYLTSSAAAGTYTLSLDTNITDQAVKTLDAAAFNSVTGVKLVITTPDSTEVTVTIDSSGGSIFTMNSANNSLVLDGAINLVGKDSNSAAVVTVSAGTLVLSGKAKITGNTYSSGGGGVQMQGGTFTMQGGEISGNTSGDKGGGVKIYGAGDFTMTGGSIKTNTGAESGGGVALENGGTFTMTGGSITNNIVKNQYGSGGGVFTWGSDGMTIDIRGGALSGNTAGSDGYGDQVIAGKNGGGEDHYRDAAVTSSVSLYAKYESSAWTYGDTGANWNQ